MTGKDEYRPDLVGDGHDGEPLLRAKQVAEWLGVHPKRVYDLPIPRVRVSPKRIRYRPVDVVKYLDRRGETP